MSIPTLMSMRGSGRSLEPAAPVVGAPIVTTGGASNLADTSATLLGTVNPNNAAVSNYHFEYGTTTGLGTSTSAGTLSSGSLGVGVSRNISSLSANTRYYYKLFATNSQGTTGGAIDDFFTTGASNVLRQDLSTVSNPEDLWGDSTGDMVDLTRHQLIATGGPDGGPFRRLSVHDGDSMGFSGERAELGNNSRSNGLASSSNPSGTFYIYQEGTRRITSYWLRLGSDWPLSSGTWQVVTQMKQAQPYSGSSSSSPILSLEARSNSWKLLQHPSGTSETVLWSTPASVSTWTQFEWDVTFSSSTSGSVKLTVDGNDSGTITARTMSYCTVAGYGLSVGDAIPSHLRIGVYHNASLDPTSIDIADVQISSP